MPQKLLLYIHKDTTKETMIKLLELYILARQRRSSIQIIPIS
ncbi:MAG: hypothetical protein Q8N79_01985 [Candidatus Methanoperedens sp.]|nr:hypothetical protein [Candidatus Methanoperedens sp.]